MRMDFDNMPFHGLIMDQKKWRHSHHRKTQRVFQIAVLKTIFVVAISHGVTETEGTTVLFCSWHLVTKDKKRGDS